jgi:carbamoyl-phosphate synthase large subunit
MRVLVTGIGGDIGNGIGRILRDCSSVENIIGCDIHDEHAGHLVFDDCLIVPRASSSDYFSAINVIRRRHQIDAIIVTSEQELRCLSALPTDLDPFDLPFVMANKKSMLVGFDKLRTAEFISALGVRSPRTWPVCGSDPDNFPCVLKSRVGAGNASVYIVQEGKHIHAYRSLFPNYIWQEYIPDQNNEYTCGIYGCADGEIRTIIFRRRLVSGVTGYAELVENDEINSVCVTIARALNLRGSINIQLRLSQRGPLIFEINPRFSSTVVFRHKLGFTDLVWSLEEQILGSRTTYTLSHPIGTKAYRVSDEKIS